MGDLFNDYKKYKKERKGKPKCFTDYPLYEHEAGKIAPIRKVDFLSYDGNKYCKIKFGKEIFEIKSGYLYSKPGRIGEVPNFFKDYPELKELNNG